MNNVEKATVMANMIALSSGILSIETEENKEMFQFITQYVAQRFNVNTEAVIKTMREFAKEARELSLEILEEALE